MNQTDKLLRAFIEASGYEIEEVVTHNECTSNLKGILFCDDSERIYTEVITDYKVTKKPKDKNEWISVKDSLPEKDGAYWTFNGLDEKPTVIQQRVHMYDSSHKIFNCYTVTHWMPLPEPPKGVS